MFPTLNIRKWLGYNVLSEEMLFWNNAVCIECHCRLNRWTIFLIKMYINSTYRYRSAAREYFISTHLNCTIFQLMHFFMNYTVGIVMSMLSHRFQTTRNTRFFFWNSIGAVVKIRENGKENNNCWHHRNDSVYDQTHSPAANDKGESVYHQK